MVNKVILIGRAGKDPVLHTTQSGRDVAQFSFATSESFKDDQVEGGWREETQWHNIVVWGKTADAVSKKIKKGDQVFVEGKLKYRTYENKEGQTVYITEVVGFARGLCIAKKSTTEKLPESNEAIEDKNPAKLNPENKDDLPF